MISDALIERYLTGDLPEDQKRHLETQAEGDAALRARIQALKDERAAFLSADPPAQFAHRLRTRLAVEREPETVPWWRRAWVPALSAALVVLIGVATLLRLGRDQSLAPQAVSERALDGAKETIVAQPEPTAKDPAPKPDAIVETIPSEEKVQRDSDKIGRGDARPLAKERAKAEKKADKAEDYEAKREEKRSGGGAGYAQPPRAGKGDASKNVAPADSGSAWRESEPKAAEPPPTPAPQKEQAPNASPPPATTTPTAPRADRRTSDDAMGDLASKSNAGYAPSPSAEAADERPKKTKTASLDPSDNAPAVIVMTRDGPRRAAFLSQSVRAKRGSSAKVTGRISRADFVYVVILYVDAAGNTRTLAQKSGTDFSVSASTPSLDENAALVLLTSSSPIQTAELQARAAKLRTQALSLTFIPTELQPRFVRILVEE